MPELGPALVRGSRPAVPTPVTASATSSAMTVATRRQHQAGDDLRDAGPGARPATGQPVGDQQQRVQHGRCGEGLPRQHRHVDRGRHRSTGTAAAEPPGPAPGTRRSACRRCSAVRRPTGRSGTTARSTTGRGTPWSGSGSTLRSTGRRPRSSTAPFGITPPIAADGEQCGHRDRRGGDLQQHHGGRRAPGPAGRRPRPARSPGRPRRSARTSRRR